MRIDLRTFGRLCAAAAFAGALALSACQQQQAAPADDETTTSSQSDEAREAQLAAQQLSALGGPADAQTQALYQGDFQASGSLDAGSGEGAWEMKLLNDYAQLTRPGLGDDGGVPGQRDFHAKGMRVVAGPLTITIMNESCQLPNGLSFEYSAHVIFEGVSYDGCARRGVAETEQSGWASVLPDLLPAIDACLAHAEAKPARVTIASALDEGQVSVRLREADGDRRECITTSDGSNVSAYEAVSDLDRRAGEGDPEFQRGGAQPAARHCQTVTEAKSPSGQSLGWLISRSC